MGAIPIISAGVGIAGSLIGMSERKREERRQAELIQAQLDANSRAEAFRYQNIMSQRQFLLQNYITSNMQRLAEYSQAEAQARIAGMKLQAENSNIAGALGVQRGEFDRNFIQNNEAVARRGEDYDNAAAENLYGALVQQAQTSKEAANILNQLNTALETGNIELASYAANLLTNQGGRESEASNASVEQQSMRQLAELLSKFKDVQNVNEQQVNNILMSEDFGRLLDLVTEAETGSAYQTVNRQYATDAETNNANQRINSAAFNTNASALAKQIEMIPTNALIDQTQADMNFLIGNTAIGAEAGGIAAQTLSNNAQLLRSMPPKTSVLSDIFSVVGAASPLLSLFAPSSFVPTNTNNNVISKWWLNTPEQTTSRWWLN